MKVVIFDFDGVIADTEWPCFQILKAVLEKRGVKLNKSYFPKTIGRSTQTILTEDFKQIFTQAELTTMFDDYELEFQNRIFELAQPMQPTVNFLKSYLGKTRFIIASMSPGWMIEKILIKFELFSKFELIISRENVHNHKPHPEIYLKSIEMLGCLPEDCVVIEDSVPGVIAANKAKINCQVLLNGYSKKRDFEGILVQGFLKTQQDFQTIFTE